jgi:hypothetical protein
MCSVIHAERFVRMQRDHLELWSKEPEYRSLLSGYTETNSNNRLVWNHSRTNPIVWIDVP